jgi:hypothetical protein
MRGELKRISKRGLKPAFPGYPNDKGRNSKWPEGQSPERSDLCSLTVSLTVSLTHPADHRPVGAEVKHPQDHRLALSSLPLTSKWGKRVAVRDSDWQIAKKH